MEGCKHELEISVPAQDVEQETGKVTEQFQNKAHLKGFRPGKAPLSLVRKSFSSDIRQKVLENLVPRFFEAKVKEENLRMVGSPSISDVHFHDGEPLRFKAQFEVYPEFELAEYRQGRGVAATPNPRVTPEDVEKALSRRSRCTRPGAVRETKIPARPLAEGDYAVVSLESLSGTDEGIKSDEVQVLIPAGPRRSRGFTEKPDRELQVSNEEGVRPSLIRRDYGRETLAGKTDALSIVSVKGLRRKELPELNRTNSRKTWAISSRSTNSRKLSASHCSAQRQNEAQRVPEGQTGRKAN